MSLGVTLLSVLLSATLGTVRSIPGRFSVCYHDLGCIDNTGWFRLLTRPINLLPASRDKIDTRFLLYTRNRRATGVLLKAADPSGTSDSDFRSSRLTKILIHGFIQNGADPWLRVMTENLLVHGDYNVVVVDWGGGAGRPYPQAAANGRLVGLEIAFFVNTLVEQFGVLADQVHIIGHSLGAHIAGYAGEKIAGLGRITGLDPAGPFFRRTPNYVRLDPSDASFVDVVHTNGADGLTGVGFGLDEAGGHLDFYVNGGSRQPGCRLPTRLAQLPNPVTMEAINAIVFCHHRRSCDLFAESLVTAVRPVAYEAGSHGTYFQGNRSCGPNHLNCAVLGIDADAYPSRSRTNVHLYIATAGSSPFFRS